MRSLTSSDYGIPADRGTLDSLFLLLLRDDQCLALLLLQACVGTGDEQAVCKALTTVFLGANHFSSLIDHAFEMELDSIPKTQQTVPTTFLRGDKIPFMKLLQEFLARKGQPYRQYLIQPLIRRLGEHADLEINPVEFRRRKLEELGALFEDESSRNELSKEENEQVQLNLVRLREIAQEFFGNTIDSIAKLPRLFCEILGLLTKRVLARFPKVPHTESFSFMGSIIFLRFICPAVALPVEYGVVESRPQASVSRSLIIISKMLVNLSNGVEFSEAYMLGLNSFIVQNRFTLRSYFRHLAHRSATTKGQREEPESNRTRTLSTPRDGAIDVKKPHRKRRSSSDKQNALSPRTEVEQQAAQSSQPSVASLDPRLMPDPDSDESEGVSCSSSSDAIDDPERYESLTTLKIILFSKYVSAIVSDHPVLRVLVSNWVAEHTAEPTFQRPPRATDPEDS